MMKRLLLAAAAGLFCATAFAEYPEKPITIVVPFAAGGPTDKVARDLAEALRKPLGQPEHHHRQRRRRRRHARRGQGGARHAGRLHAAAAPHRHGDVAGALSQDDVRHARRLRVPRHDQRRADDDRRQAGPAREQLHRADEKWLEANKGRINLANAGLGAASHLCGLLFQSTLKIDMQTVPYKGTAPAMNDLLGGQVDLMCDQTTNTTGQIAPPRRSRPTRSPRPERLTTAGAEGPADARRSRPEKLQRDHLARGLLCAQGHAQGGGSTRSTRRSRPRSRTRNSIKREEALGAVIISDGRVSGAEHKKFVEAEINKWGPVIKAAGQYAD